MKRTRILLGALFLLGAATAYGQSCANCKNLAPSGDMMQIPTTGQGYLNTFGIDWLSSHGSPSYSPGSLWMWSYDNYGEGVYYQGFNFIAGHTYCITVDTYTRTHNNNPAVADAGYNIVATNSMVPYEVTSGGTPVPPIPPGDIVASVNWGTLPMNGWSTPSYTFTATNNWSQLWFYPHASALPQVELTLQNLRICDITVPNPCEFDLGIGYDTFAGCGYQFYGNIGLPSGLAAIAYLWDFGDGTTSNAQNPIHYYTAPGGYLVKLTVLVVNQNGKCCPRVVEIWVEAQPCEPCKIVDVMDYTFHGNGNFDMTFTATGPNTPNYVYYWDFGDGTKGKGHSVNHTYGSEGTYAVTLTVYYFNAESGDCCSKQITKEVWVSKEGSGGPVILPTGEKMAPASPTGFTDIPESVKERPAAEAVSSPVGIFPNPTGGAFTVTSATVDIDRIVVSDAQGRTIQIVKDAGKKSVALSLEDQRPGTYTISVELVNGTKYTNTTVRN
jgi:PKD repeat protein